MFRPGMQVNCTLNKSVSFVMYKFLYLATT